MRLAPLLLAATAAGLGCRRADAPVDAVIMAAVSTAYSLQDRAWDSLRIGWQGDSAMRHHHALAYYRQAFGDSLAQFYAGYTAGGGPEKIMDVPDSIVVLSSSRDHATVLYPTPLPLQEIWRAAPYTVDDLDRIQGRWLIVHTTRVAEKPAAP
ncbi:MAG TPA: hypothetical protein VGV12_15705 [Gemmatimonadales bacterium]|nr:hypothetical protein [Gemmatimonadales bacterium]